MPGVSTRLQRTLLPEITSGSTRGLMLRNFLTPGVRDALKRGAGNRLIHPTDHAPCRRPHTKRANTHLPSHPPLQPPRRTRVVHPSTLYPPPAPLPFLGPLHPLFLETALKISTPVTSETARHERSASSITAADAPFAALILRRCMGRWGGIRSTSITSCPPRPYERSTRSTRCGICAPYAQTAISSSTDRKSRSQSTR